jgi:hypothetical protein
MYLLHCRLKSNWPNGRRYFRTSTKLKASAEGTLNYFKKAVQKTLEPSRLIEQSNVKEIADMVILIVVQFVTIFAKPLDIDGTDYTEGKPFRIAPRLNWAISQFSLHCSELSAEPESQPIM